MSSYLPSRSSANHRRTTAQATDDHPIAPGPRMQGPGLAPAPNVRPLFQFLSFGLILFLGSLQFLLPVTHFRNPSDPLRNWIPLKTSSPLTELGTSRNGDSGGDDGMVHVVSWMDCLDLRLLAVLANSTLSSSRYPDLVYFHFFVPGGNEDRVSFYKLKVLFPHSNLEIHGPAREAINTDSWIKDEDEQKFKEKISRSLKHFNSQSDGNNDQDPTLDLNSSIRDGCLEEESFGIQDDIGINSAVKNSEILKGLLLGPRLVKISGNKKVVPLAENVFIKGKDMEVYEEEKYWNLGGSIFKLRSCNHMILKENEFEIWRRQRKKINSLSRDDCIGNLCSNDKVNCKTVMRIDKKNSAESIFPFAENVKEKYEMASIYGWTSSAQVRKAWQSHWHSTIGGATISQSSQDNAWTQFVPSISNQILDS
ncbi:hypothetical protein GH714_009429 [Hevea brasiliensis]|uniref:Uncharacterized protein n=1 Tax=Hevea brasiliensis TaxID=3981 RepID=A0A6A6LP82_HEVBR|nr:hypothetical protein GH714_009429 [Hevea brasiliensis]